ncbi:MAG: SPOR domain-containing protein [Blastocatellia bacterium]
MKPAFAFRTIALSLLLTIPVAVPVLAQQAYTTQIASFSNEAEADAKVAALKEKGVDAYWVTSKVPGAGVRYRVRTGRFASLAQARANGERLKKNGAIEDFFGDVYITPPKSAASTPASAPKPEPKAEPKSEPKPAPPAPPTQTKVAAATVPGEGASVRPRTTTPPGNETAVVAPPVVKPTPAPKMPVTKPVAPTPTPSPVTKPDAGKGTIADAKTKNIPATGSVATGKASRDTMMKQAGMVIPGFKSFRDATIGYSLEHPSYWTGAAWGDAERMAQNVDGGASFKSREDAAFLNIIWNKLPGANDPKKYDNTLLVDTIVKSMGSGAETQSLNELSRRVENLEGQIRTFVDLNALFRDPNTSATLNFLGKAVITRCQEGILLVVVFYSQDGPTAAATNAERIIQSVRAPGV